MKTMQMDMNTSLRCYILSENGANKHDKINEVSYTLGKRRG